MISFVVWSGAILFARAILYAPTVYCGFVVVHYNGLNNIIYLTLCFVDLGNQCFGADPYGSA
jgi:hypothetical protein